MAELIPSSTLQPAELTKTQRKNAKKRLKKIAADPSDEGGCPRQRTQQHCWTPQAQSSDCQKKNPQAPELDQPMLGAQQTKAGMKSTVH